ncbi:MAG: M50 family metallopeptidase [Myxococcales bacterium]|nr:M50 family metallopeptidase [Myxococcales bacterium]
MKLRAKSSLNKKTSWAIILASIFTLMLYVVPFLRPLSYPFLLLSTLVHEMSHGLAAVLVGGYFNSFVMWADGSGAAHISGNFGRVARAFVAGAGLIGPALMAAVFFVNLRSLRRSRAVLTAFGIILLLAILLVVRNLFGVAFVAGVCGLCWLFSLGTFKEHAQTLVAFFGAQLSLSVFSRSDYLFTDVAHTSAGVMPSDVAQMAQALWLPYWVFGALCGLVSLAVLLFGIKKIFK